MIGVVVQVLGYVDGSYPGWVECVLTDAHGREWSFREKVPVLGAEGLGPEGPYPCRAVIACAVLERRVATDGQESVVIDTAQPWSIESTDGETRFAVRPDQLEEFGFCCGSSSDQTCRRPRPCD